jgi:hypothetical protein
MLEIPDSFPVASEAVTAKYHVASVPTGGVKIYDQFTTVPDAGCGTVPTDTFPDMSADVDRYMV